jgi:hypothetical protein
MGMWEMFWWAVIVGTLLREWVGFLCQRRWTDFKRSSWTTPS